MSEAPIRTILERLEQAEDAPESSARTAEERLLESIRSSLQRVLNTPRGFTPSAPDLGLGELIDVSLNSRSMGKIESELKRTIERFEPRLTSVKVSFVPGTDQRLTLRFDVRGRIKVGNTHREALFQTRLDPQKPMQVTRT